MAGERLSNYDTAMAHLKGAETDGPQISDDTITPTAQYDLAAAQVRAQLAVADEMRALRESVDALLRQVARPEVTLRHDGKEG